MHLNADNTNYMTCLTNLIISTKLRNSILPIILFIVYSSLPTIIKGIWLQRSASTNESKFVWNASSSSSISWQSYHIEVCRMWCDKNGQLRRKFESTCALVECYQCDCHPSCYFYGTCCLPLPDVQAERPTLSNTIGNNGEESSSTIPPFYLNSSASNSIINAPKTKDENQNKIRSAEFFPQFAQHIATSASSLPKYPSSIPFTGTLSCMLPPSPPFADNSHYVIVSKCPSTWKGDLELKRNCEKPADTEMSSLDDITPYTVLDTGLTFANLHCVECHGHHHIMSPLSKLQSKETIIDSKDKKAPIAHAWNLKIKCKHFQFFYQLNDSYSFYKKTSLYRPDFCLVTYEKPEKASALLKHCSPWKQPLVTPASVPPITPVSTCRLNIPEVTRLCLDLDQVLSLRVAGFKNVFCALCNGRVPEEGICPYETPDNIIVEKHRWSSLVPPISLLWRIGGKDLRSWDKVHANLDQKCPLKGMWANDEVSLGVSV